MNDERYGDAINVENSHDIEITDCEIHDCYNDGIFIGGSNLRNIKVSKIHTFNNGLNGIEICNDKSVIDKAMKYAEDSGELTEVEMRHLNRLLKDIKRSSSKPGKVRKAIDEIKSIGKACIPQIVKFLLDYFFAKPQ